MNIYIDESGTFPSTNTPDSWCVIAAYVSPESDRKALCALVETLRRRAGGFEPEIKLGMLTEAEYFQFLKKLSRMSGTVFVAATDMSLNPIDVVKTHKDVQASRVVEHIDKMKHQSMKDGLTSISNSIRAMPSNLYSQMIFQISLFHEIVRKSTLYYVQRTPQTLKEFRWRVDQKDIRRTGYETVFRTVLPSILQSMSFRNPIHVLEGCDYSHMAQYEFTPERRPTYLTEDYGLPAFDGFDIGKMVGGNFQFVDSKSELGVQVADLLASGFRRLLKSEFSDNLQAAVLLGRLCIQSYKNDVPLKLFTMGEESVVNDKLAKNLRVLRTQARPMLK